MIFTSQKMEEHQQIKCLSSNCVFCQQCLAELRTEFIVNVRGLMSKGNFAFLWAYIYMYACTEGQALHRYTCLHPLVLHINDSQESHANWYISHCVRMCFNRKLIPIPLLSCLHWVVDDWFLFICSFCSSSWGALQHPPSSHSALF